MNILFRIGLETIITHTKKGKDLAKKLNLIILLSYLLDV